MNVLAQLDQTKRPLRRRLAALAFLDVVGYSRLVATDEEATLLAWSILQRSLIEPQIQTWRGRIVDRAGDGIFAEFDSALGALRWAVEVQNAAEHHPHPGKPIRLRIALHLADVVDGRDGQVQGDGVNTVARLQTYAENGGIIVSQALMDAVQGKTDTGFVDLGLLHLRNLKYPVHAFRVSATPASRLRRLRWSICTTAGAAGILLAAMTNVPNWRTSSHEQAERLLQQGLAIKCPTFPCPAQWLQQRALFEQAIAADPNFARPHAEAALTYTNFVSSRLSADAKEDLRAAASLATRAVAFAPDQAFAHKARAAVMRQDPEKLEEALASYMRVLLIDPKQTAARANAGFMLLLLGRPAEAEPYLKAALDAEPNSISAPAWLNRMGLVDMFLDREGYGTEYFHRAIEQQSQAEAMADQGMERTINLAAALALSGKMNEARWVVEQQKRQYPSLSTKNIWICACSRAVGFRDGLAKLRRGAILAGVTQAD